jgi:hypothetical protein
VNDAIAAAIGVKTAAGVFARSNTPAAAVA